ncbi:MAG: hypothetical protein FJW35_14625 [Acidobacteria bacterium]|nr:hypothetical protein [Acidobacteriota bacterium]
MRYHEFRDQLQDALQRSGLFVPHDYNPTETIDLSGAGRRWKLYVIRSSPPSAEPFHVSAKIAFHWSPFDAARAYTCEEDLLTELFGRRKQPMKTVQRFTRVDLELRAGLPYGSTTPIPGPQILAAWTDSVSRKLDKLFTEHRERQGRLVAVLGGLEEVHIEARCDKEGVPSLAGVSVAGFRFVRVPRVWDDPDRREAEKGAAQELARLAQRFKDALDEWTVSVVELARWIRYAPPPPGAKQIEPWFEDLEEEGGPESIH